MSAADTIARGLASQARGQAQVNAAALAVLAARPRDRYDGSIVAMGDSITANTVGFQTVTNNSDSWFTRGIFTMLVARSLGRLKPVTITGWPYAGGPVYTGIAAALVARGGQGYSSQTTLSVQSTNVGGGSGAVLTPVIASGVITSVTVNNPGAGYSVSPIITVTDPGGGTGAAILSQTNGTGEYAVGGIGSIEAEAYVPLILNNGNPVARNVLLLIGTNNNGRGIGLADSKASILSICQRLVAGGVRPIVIAVLDRNASNGGTAQLQALALRRWQVTRLAALAPGTVVVDPSPWINDPNGAVPNSITAQVMADGLHPTAYGADLIARRLWDQLGPLFPGIGSYGTYYGNEQYDAVYNPEGNILRQAFTRNEGAVTVTAGEAPWTGTRHANIVLARIAGGTGTGTIAAAQENRTDGMGGTFQTLNVNVTGAAAGEVYRLMWTIPGGSSTAPTFPVGGANPLQIGDRIVGAIDEVQMSNVANLRGMKLRLQAANVYAPSPTTLAMVTSPTGAAAWGDLEDTNFPAWTGDSFRLATREFTVPANTIGVTMYMDFVVNSAGAASFNARLFGASVRRTG